MAQQLYFSRDTKMFLEFDGYVWEIPVLDGFSFSQATNSSEITLNEMESSAGVSRRGRRAFNDSLAPGEWSFSTYVRPFTAAGATQGTGSADTAAEVHAVEEVLWALMAGADNYAAAKYDKGGTDVLVPGGSSMAINFDSSNVAQLSTFNLYFVLGNDNRTVMKLDGCVVGEASLDFDIDGIATIAWSGNCANVVDFTGSVHTDNTLPIHSDSTADGVGTIAVGDVWLDANDGHRLYVMTNVGNGSEAATAYVNEAILTTTNFIRNRLTVLTVTPTTRDPDSDGANELETNYSLTLTGGNVTISNNITFITPEEIGTVNVPIGHVTGTRSVSGSFTCYLTEDTGTTNASRDFFEDLRAITNVVTNSFGLVFKIGGASGTGLELNMATSHVEIPTHSIEDVISLETNFQALPSTIDGTNELALTYRP
tara:strand:+ start:2134 stop:3411 length:1278 start_codon:yes stop_codon:yes gene_type:complete